MTWRVSAAPHAPPARCEAGRTTPLVGPARVDRRWTITTVFDAIRRDVDPGAAPVLPSGANTWWSHPIMSSRSYQTS